MSHDDKYCAWSPERITAWRDAMKRLFVNQDAVDSICDLAIKGLSAPSATRPHLDLTDTRNIFEREAAMSSAVPTLADELERLDRKATQGPWSNKILQDFRGVSGSNDTPYIYGPESHPNLLMGLWPVHPPEETAAVEQRMFDTLDLICTLRNNLPAIIAALRATRSATLAPEDVIVPGEVFDWLMGRGEGFEPKGGANFLIGKFWWRSELRRRINEAMAKRNTPDGSVQS